MNLPRELLDAAMKETGAGQTETVIAGLERLVRSQHYRDLRSLRGSAGVELDLEASREERSF